MYVSRFCKAHITRPVKHARLSFIERVIAIGLDTKIEVIVVSPTTWEAHHSPRAKPSVDMK